MIGIAENRGPAARSVRVGLVIVDRSDLCKITNNSPTSADRFMYQSYHRVDYNDAMPDSVANSSLSVRLRLSLSSARNSTPFSGRKL